MKLFIKNMACESCKILVKEELEKIGIQALSVHLGEAEIKETLSAGEQIKFGNAIKKAGLELVNNREGILMDLIKSSIKDYIEHTELKSNLSDYLARKLHYDYAYLSSYFSAVQAATIEQYMIALKTEKVKEMLILEGLTLTEIAYKLNYSSVAHLSHQFKKTTGLTASHFKKLRNIRRLTIQSL